MGIPLIVRWPDALPAGKRSQTLISLVDIMPTLLSLCGVAVSRDVAGRDLSAAFKGETVSVESVYIEGRMRAKRVEGSRRKGTAGGYGEWRAIVTEQYKLAMDCEGVVRRFSNLKDDPFELNNLANRPECAEKQKELIALLAETGKKTGDPFPEAVTPA